MGPAKHAFTTSQAADLCGVSVRTLKRWLDRRELSGYRLPVSGEWRIPRQELVAFMERHGIPLGDLEAYSRRRVLCVSDDSALVEGVRDALSADTRFEVQHAAEAYQACLKIGQSPPHIVLIDLSCPGVDCSEMIRTIAENPATKQARIVFISDQLYSDARLSALGHASLLKPLQVPALLQLIYSYAASPAP